MSSNSNNEPVIIPLNKFKLVTMSFGAALFVAAGIWFVTNPSSFTKNTFSFMGSTKIIVVGWAAILFFGACLIMIFRKIFDNKLGFVINGQGIVDNSSGASAGLIPWADITGLTVRQVYNQKFIMVMVKNPEEYIERHAGAIKRNTVKLNHQMYGSPISISANSLKCSFDELHALLTERLKKHNGA